MILSILGVILLIFATILALLLLALLLPIRFGVEARGDMGFDEGIGNVRIYGGILGGGVRIRRGVAKSSEPWRATLGLMIWRWFVPVYSRTVGAKPEPKRPKKPSKTPAGDTPFAPDDFDAGDFDVPEERSDSTRGQSETSSAPEQTDTPEPKSERTESPPEPMPYTETKHETVARSEPEQTARIKPAPKPVRQHRKPTLQPLREFVARIRALFAEWWPVFTGVLRRLRGVLRVTRFHVVGELGLNDPAITGQTVGYLMAMRGLSVRNGFLARIGLDRGALRIAISPAFDGYVLRGYVAAEVRLSLIRVWSAALFAAWKVYRNIRAGRARNKHSAMVSPASAAA